MARSGQHPDRPAAEPEAELGAEQGGHHRVGAGVADRLDGVGQRADPAVAAARRRLLGRPADGGDEDGGEEEADAVGERRRRRARRRGRRPRRRRRRSPASLPTCSTSSRWPAADPRRRRGSAARPGRPGRRTCRAPTRGPGPRRRSATGPWEATRNSPAAAACSSETVIISVRRSKRSAAGPASGLRAKAGQRLDHEHRRGGDVRARPVDDQAEHGHGGEPVPGEGDDLGDEDAPGSRRCGGGARSRPEVGVLRVAPP